MKKHLYILVVLLLTAVLLFGQNKTGLVSSNYAGISSLDLNPALMGDSKIYADVQFLSLSGSFDNNYLYIDQKDYNFLDFFNSEEQLKRYGTNGNYITKDYYNTKDKKGYINLNIGGPGGMVSIGRHTFAFRTSLRTAASLIDMPYHLAKFLYDFKEDRDEDYNGGTFSIGGLSWGEIGISYAFTLSAWGKNKITAGISYKHLTGYAGGYIYNNEVNYRVSNDKTLEIHNMQAHSAFALPVDYESNNHYALDNKIATGRGSSFDFGFVYQRKKYGNSNTHYTHLCEQVYDDYLYKIGIAFIDIGSIGFNDKVQKYQFDNARTNWTRIDTFEFHSVDYAKKEVVRHFDNHKSGEKNFFYKEGGSFRMYLPAALSLQFDYHLKKNIFISALWTHSIKLSDAQLRRPSELALSPRYETENFGLYLPLKLNNYTTPAIGLAVRYHLFVLGTDRLGSFLNMSDFTGMDIYFSIKLSLLKGHCKKKSTSIFRKKAICNNLIFN